MGKIIAACLEDCIFNIQKDKKGCKIFKPNNSVINFIKSKLDDNYKLYVISNFCESEYVDIEATFQQYEIPLENFIYACEKAKADLILNQIKPQIYIDTHIELCAGLDFYEIDTYLFTENSCIANNKCATGLKIL